MTILLPLANVVSGIRKDNQREINWFQAGIASLNQGRNEAALQELRRAAAHNGPHRDLYRALAAAWARIGRPAKAVEALLQALVLSPGDTEIQQELRVLCGKREVGSTPPRAVWSSVTSELDPRGPFGGVSPESAISQADRLQGSGRLGPALDWCLKAVVLAPDDHLHAARAADLLLRLGRREEGRRLLARAAELSPTAAAYQQIGSLAQDLQDFAAAAEAYDRALTLDPDFIPALCAAGHLRQDQGYLEEANIYLERAHRLKPDPLVRIVMEAALPPLYDSLEDMHKRRTQLESNLRRLVAEGGIVDPTERAIPTNFYAAYHGLNDRALAENLGRIYRPRVDHVCSLRPGYPSRKLRVGILSKFFCRHTIGRLNLGTVQKLSRERFEVIVISARRPDDPFAHEFVTAADQYIVLPEQPAAAIEQIRQLELDVLLFTDVGMDPFTYSLAFARSAPVQCVTWGHPVTTGSPTMDFFVSSSRLEIPEAQDHYTEELVRLDNLAVYYPRPTLPNEAPGRHHFGFSNDDHLYGCPQTLFKFHPEFDEILACILTRDPRGRLVLIEGRHTSWTDRLRHRLEQRIGRAMDRVHFLPKLSWQEFMGLTHFVDVLLDPIHFGGGNTSYEALAMGTPVVSLPGQFLRSRITLALYQRMGFDECLVETNDEYIELALKLGIDSEYRESIHSRIVNACHVLYEDVGGIRELEAFWDKAVSHVAQRAH